MPFAGTLDDILCVQEERIVSDDNTVWGRSLQIPADRHHYVKVRGHEYLDHTLAVKPRCLARYQADSAIPPTRKAP